MKMETYKKAENLIDRINHISKVLEFIDEYEYELDPPTRQSNYDICVHIGDERINLNEGEVVFLRKALEDEKFKLSQEFVML